MRSITIFGMGIITTMVLVYLFAIIPAKAMSTSPSAKPTLDQAFYICHYTFESRTLLKVTAEEALNHTKHHPLDFSAKAGTDCNKEAPKVTPSVSPTVMPTEGKKIVPSAAPQTGRRN